MHPLTRILVGGGLLVAMFCFIASVVVHTFVFSETDLDTFLQTMPGTILGIIGTLGAIAVIVGFSLKIGSHKSWSFGGEHDYED